MWRGRTEFCACALVPWQIIIINEENAEQTESEREQKMGQIKFSMFIAMLARPEKLSRTLLSTISTHAKLYLGKIYRNVETHSAHVVCDYFRRHRVLAGARHSYREFSHISVTVVRYVCAGIRIAAFTMIEHVCCESRIRMVKLVAVVSSSEHEGNGCIVSRSYVFAVVHITAKHIKYMNQRECGIVLPNNKITENALLGRLTVD